MNDIECSSLLDEDLDAAEQKTGSALITIFIMEVIAFWSRSWNAPKAGSSFLIQFFRWKNTILVSQMPIGIFSVQYDIGAIHKGPVILHHNYFS
jgi:hypothetical protein